MIGIIASVGGESVIGLSDVDDEHKPGTPPKSKRGAAGR
jgi:hypothetical protein